MVDRINNISHNPDGNNLYAKIQHLKKNNILPSILANNNIPKENNNTIYSDMGIDISNNKTQPSDEISVIKSDYDNDGKIDNETIFKGDEQIESISYSYDDKKGVTIADHEYWKDGDVYASKKSYIIDKEEVYREEQTFNKEGSTDTFAIYKEDQLFSRGETKFYTEEDDKDLNGLEKETRIYNKEGLTKIIEYKYEKDTEGSVIACTETTTDILTGDVKIERYDEEHPKILVSGAVNPIEEFLKEQENN